MDFGHIGIANAYSMWLDAITGEFSDIFIIEQGDVLPLVAKTYPLTQIVDAQTAFLEKNFTGKIVLSING